MKRFSRMPKGPVTALICLVSFAGRGLAEAEKIEPNLVILVVGVSDYKVSSLANAAKDARDVAAAFQAQQGKQFAKVDATVLTDARATRANIESELHRLAGRVRRHDYVIVFLAGHGNIDPQGRYYFLPHDGQPGNSKTTVPASVLGDKLSRLPGKRFLILDTCRAAGAGGDVSALKATTSPMQSLAESGLVIYAACMARESSGDGGSRGNGLFTLALLEALKGKADANRDGKVILAELEAYIANRVHELSNGVQNPTMQKPGNIPSGLSMALVPATAPPGATLAQFASNLPKAPLSGIVPTVVKSVANTVWTGAEELQGFGALTFEIGAADSVTMIDAQSKIQGSCTQQGNDVVLQFQNCVYRGRINGRTLTGIAEFTSGADDGTRWSFAVNLK